MKRNMDLVRLLLIVYESVPEDSNVWWWNDTPEIPKFHKEEIDYHIALMCDAGLLKPTKIKVPKRDEITVGVRMTWDGHDFLEACRDENRWKKAKKIAGKVGVFTIEILKQILAQLVQTQLKQVMG